MEASLLTGIEIFLAFIFLLLSAIVAAADVAFFSFTKKDVNQMRRSEDRKIRKISKLFDNPNRLLTTILCADILMNLSFVAVSVIMIHRFCAGWISPFILLPAEIILLGAVVFILGEIIPKIYAVKHLDKTIRRSAPIVWFFMQILRPITSVLLKSTHYVEEKIHIKMQSFSINEYSDVINPAEGEFQDEAQFMKGIAHFRDKDVKQIMKSRMDVVAVEAATPLPELIDIIKKHGYSRIPVYKDNFEEIEGILYVKDLLPYISKQSHFDLLKILHKPFYIPESKLIGDLLSDFKAKKIHFAVVVDEYGVLSGIVTLEDIIEEIVGDIKDEFDSLNMSPEYVKVNDTTYLFPGKFPLTDFARIMDIEEDFFDEIKGENDTLAGLLIEYMEDIPEKGEVINIDPFVFTIEDADQQRIKEIRASYMPKSEMDV